VRVLLVEKTDRFYRNLKDWVTIDELEVEIHFPKEGVVLSRDFCVQVLDCEHELGRFASTDTAGRFALRSIAGRAVAPYAHSPPLVDLGAIGNPCRG
jgi:hypothetical protein